MGKKYIIELCEKPMKNECGNNIWRVKGFNTLVFDQNGLDKLEEYKEPETHKFVVGDIVTIKGASSMEAILTYVSIRGMGPIYYMFRDGSCNKALSKDELIFVRHEDYLMNFLDNGGLK